MAANMSGAMESGDAPVDAAYLGWKSWQAGDFGRCDALQARYFEAETGLAHDSGARVLELGFGNGAFLGWAQARGAEVHGVELNPVLVGRATQLLGPGRAGASLEPLAGGPLAGSFALIVAFDVLEHVASADIPPLLATLRTLLARDGRLLLRFPNGDSPFGRLNQHGDPTHQTTIGAEKLRWFAAEAGLAVQVLRAPAMPLRGVGLARGLRRALVLAGRALVERVIAQLYFGGRRLPLDPNYVAVLRAGNPR